MDAFTVDDEYDREHASNGRSRYAAYVAQATFEPFDDPGTAAELAAFAWRQATGPVMVPGYVRRHPRILSAQVSRSDWDGSLVATVDILTSLPDGLRSGGWRDWPSQWSFGSSREAYFEPAGEELARDRYMLASVSLRFKVPGLGLPEPGVLGAGFEACKEAIGVVVYELNVIVGPVLDRIEGT